MAEDIKPAGDSVELSVELEQPVRRRPIVKALTGAAIAGTLGYAGYPWVVGEKREGLVAGLRSFLEDLREQRRTGRPREREVAVTRELPVVLDANGKEYEAFLTRLNLRHIKPIEMLRPHFKMRGTVSNDLPPREVWQSIAPTLRVADELRQRLGVRLLTIASAYRSPAYNAMCPGAVTNSFHVRNMALDLMFDCAPEEVVKAAKTLRDEGFFAGGIGRYPTFTHIDTRGRAADWS
jgi:hypothetical protein